MFINNFLFVFLLVVSLAVPPPLIVDPIPFLPQIYVCYSYLFLYKSQPFLFLTDLIIDTRGNGKVFTFDKFYGDVHFALGCL